MWATIIGSHLTRKPTVSPVLTKCWNWELRLATNFGSYAQMVIKFGGQNLATKFGFVPDCWSQVLSREWRCSWSSADRRCFNYIWACWVTSNFIAYWAASYIRCLMIFFNKYVTVVAMICLGSIHTSDYQGRFRYLGEFPQWLMILLWPTSIHNLYRMTYLYKWACIIINSLWPADTIWRYRSKSAFNDWMKWWLTAWKHQSTWSNVDFSLAD